MQRAYRAWTAGEKGRNTLLERALDEPMALLRVASDAQLVEEAPLEGIDWLKLPPLQKRGAERRTEAFTGVGVVLGIIAACVAGTHTGVQLMACVPDHAFRRWLPLLVYGEAFIALICLLGLMFDDGAVIKRSKLTCAPTPPSVKTWLQLAESSKGRKNITGDDGRVYCVRCHVWRPRDSRAHHCATCQRCVVDFDHHCGVFGRCIAGSGLRGNMKWFVSIIAMGYCGAGTATASLLLGALKCGELSGSGSYGQFGLVALLAYAGLAVTGWLVILACRCLASLVDCVADRNERGLELV